MPSAAPSRDGTATDQPTRPIMPRPDQTVRVTLRWALSLRVSFAPTWRTNADSSGLDFGTAFWDGNSSGTMELRKAPYEAALQFCQHRAHLSLSLVEIDELPLHFLAQLAEAHAADSVAHRDQHVRPGLHQHAPVDRSVRLP